MLKATLLLLLASLCFAGACEYSLAHSEPLVDFRVSNSLEEVTWKAFGRSWRVFLSLSEVVDGNTEHFHGRLEGEVQAIVSFSVMLSINGTYSVHAMIMTPNETYWIAPSLNATVPLYIYRQSDVRYTGSDCEAPLSPPLHSDEPSERPSGEKRAISSYKVAVYVDQKFADASYNPWASEASIYSLFNDVNAVYAASGLGQFQAKTFGVLSNPYSSTTQMLPFFRDHQVGFDASYTNSIWLVGTNVGGLAYMTSSCNGQPASQRTAVAGLTRGNRLWTVKTIAHELGHNRGAYHDFTNQCSGTTSNCQCSLMSYCFPSSATPGGAVNYFSQTSINQMRSAGCL